MKERERGYFGIGIFNGKTASNIGTLWRSAYIMGASFIFTIGERIPHQASDTVKAWRNVPYFRYDSLEDFHKSLPFDCPVVGIENIPTSIPIKRYWHRPRCIYLLGAEDSGLSRDALAVCKETVILPGDVCMNVAVAGSLVMYDRIAKED